LNAQKEDAMADVQEAKFNPVHEAFVKRFVEACQADDRVLAACLIGSYAKGKADQFSDIDLMVITKDSAYDEFYQKRESFLRSLGELVFLEDFGLPDIAFHIYADGTEGELYFGTESRLAQLYDAPFRILLDKKNILTAVTYSPSPKAFDADKQTELLRQNIYGFWHEMSHFTTAMGRGQLWWARGQVESLRSICVTLARLQQDFSDTEIGNEPYFKIENCMSVEKLLPLKPTFCPLERIAMLQSVQNLLSFYREAARSLAEAHHIPYPESLERVMRMRLKNLPPDQESSSPG
jgi:predicted nucleotidyltransferase